MFKSFADWLDDRTGYRALIHEALDEPIPGGARWKYVFGSALTSTFLIQVVTGLLLMMTYSPASSTAWGSVYFINEQMTLGWFVRGIHHFGSQAMVVLLGLHLIQVLIAGAYRSPREVNWWFGLALMFLTLGLSLTGYLLPWDQKGFWATKVATNIAGSVPILGGPIQKLVIGGIDYGNQTLTRFYALHVGILPAFLIMALVAHIMLFRKHGVTHNPKDEGEGQFWPTQVLMDVAFSLLVLGVIAGLVLYFGGAHLDAPANPSDADYPARPEWYFMFLFQMLKYFPGEMEVIGTVVVPLGAVGLLAAIPLFDKLMPNRLAHFLACSLIFAMLGGALYLTYEAFSEDMSNRVFSEQREKATHAAERSLALAMAPDYGIPPEGAGYLLSTDPLTHGRAVMERKCLSCHYFNGEGPGPQLAAELSGFGTYAWVRGLLDAPESDVYFGTVPSCGGMTQWKSSSEVLNWKNVMKGDADGDGKLGEEELSDHLIDRLEEFDKDDSGDLDSSEVQQAVTRQLDEVADFVAGFAEIPRDMTPLEWVGKPEVYNHPAINIFMEDCTRCHIVDGLVDLADEEYYQEEDAPNLFAYGSPQWTERLIKKPHAFEKYGYLYDGETEGLMPAYEGQLTDNDLEMMIRYMRGDYLDAPEPMPRPEISVPSDDEEMDIAAR